MERFLWICFGGALGTGTRYLIELWAVERFGPSFPFGTLFVNVLGCAAIAFVMQATVGLASFSPTLRLALTAGFLGGLTTYSTFNYETTTLLYQGARGTALLNLAATTLGCFFSGLLGMGLARRVFGG